MDTLKTLGYTKPLPDTSKAEKALNQCPSFEVEGTPYYALRYITAAVAIGLGRACSVQRGKRLLEECLGKGLAKHRLKPAYTKAFTKYVGRRHQIYVYDADTVKALIYLETYYPNL